MYIFADSGSTKTEWIITDNEGNRIDSFKTIGLNPYFVTFEKIIEAITENYPAVPDPLIIKKVFFYGSGCGSQDNLPHLRAALEEYFFNAAVYIYSDMLGTARAVLKQNSGIAAIMGTGTNSCFYDGNSIIKNAISLGFILGDEGSGASIGKEFAKQYLEKRFDDELTAQILSETGATHSSILNAIYRNPHPNRYLAGFCIFIKNNIDHPQLQKLIQKSFEDFFEKYIKIYDNPHKYMLGFCGSIAINFKDFIIEIADRYKIKDLCFVCNPLEELIEYHKVNNFD
ncbi:MAG: hypothetical protein LBQ22_01555 [Bacteroidales bacterium]|jgi:N-acetylglucosamine kinase-like BadF-type ATPase|nr:hypothetical protein [Bacteroidales bacterium]